MAYWGWWLAAAITALLFRAPIADKYREWLSSLSLRDAARLRWTVAVGCVLIVTGSTVVLDPLRRLVLAGATAGFVFCAVQRALRLGDLFDGIATTIILVAGTNRALDWEAWFGTLVFLPGMVLLTHGVYSRGGDPQGAAWRSWMVLFLLAGRFVVQEADSGFPLFPLTAGLMALVVWLGHLGLKAPVMDRAAGLPALRGDPAGPLEKPAD
jgi:hypothetical protein